MKKFKNLVSVYHTFKNLLQNYLTEILDIAQKKSLGICLIKVCSNGGATYISQK